MDEGDRPTDADGSAGRDEGAEDHSEETADGPADQAPTGSVDEASGDPDGEPSPDADGSVSEPAQGEFGTEEGFDVDADTDAHTGIRDDTRTGSDADVASGTFTGEPERAETAEAGTDESLLYRFRHDKDGALMWIREMAASVGVVLLVGLLLFGVSGIWPPMVAVESGSMEPNMKVGDLVFVTEPGRLAPDAADNDIGVVTHETGQDAEYRTFGSYGSVVIYTPPGRTGSPIIHRAMFHVNEGENWYDRADEQYHNAVDCGSLANCPAPHDGFVTLGDNNGAYDQASGLSPPVRDEWVKGVARVRVPYLGYIRLLATGQVELEEAIARTVGNGVPVATGGVAG